MRKVLFLLQFLPVILFAQEDKHPENFGMLMADSSCRYVSLPVLWRSDFYKIYEVGRKASCHYIINQDSAYYRIFSDYSKDSLPVFDFTSKELVVSISCHSCLSLGTMNDKPRHRNACDYRYIWCVRDKKKNKINN